MRLDSFLFLALILACAPAARAASTARCEVQLVKALSPEEINYREYGDLKAEPLILVHGLGGSSASFDPVVRQLSTRYRVITYDQRGHGLSAQKGWDYSLPVMAADLASLLNHLGIKKTHIIGQSFGARTAMKFAEAFPEMTGSMIIGDMEMLPRVVDYVDEYTEKAKQTEHFPRFFTSKEEAVTALKQYLDPDELDGNLKKVVELNDGRYEYTGRLHGMFLYDLHSNGADLTEALRTYEGPLLFLRADPKHTYLTQAGVEHIQNTRPGTPIISVPGAEHSIHGTRTEEFLAHVFEFLKRNPLTAK